MRQGIKEKDVREFEKCCEKLNAVMERIRTYQPEACGYFAENSMNLMSGVPQEGSGDSHPERTVKTVYMPNYDGGAW